MVQEFKDFINRGNLVEIAVAFVMGVAFASVVSAFTDRIVSPLIGMVFNLSDLAGLGTFGEIVDGVQQGSVGAFVQAVLNFLIVAFVMFLVVKAYNRMQASEPAEEAPAEDPEDIQLLRQIRDSLAK